MGHFDADRFAFSLATLREPRREPIRKAPGGEAEAGLNAAVGGGESIVKFSGIGEIAHAELIEPLEGTGLALTANEDIDVKFLRVHGLRIASLGLTHVFVRWSTSGFGQQENLLIFVSVRTGLGITGGA